MTASKTNEREGTRASLRRFPMSASKARVVLNLIRGEDVNTAREILAGTTREAAGVIAKVLASAVANAVNNDALVAEELYVAAAYADEGITAKRFTPRARGRAGKIFKRTCHVTVIVARMDEERLELVRGARNQQAAASRSRRVASSRRRADQQASLNKREAAHGAQAELEAAEAAAASEDAAQEDDVETATEIEREFESDDVIADPEVEETTEEPATESETETAPEGDEMTDETASDDATEETN
jgi:large subunit ribosomal protein L22